MANRYGYVTNVNHVLGEDGKTVPVSATNPLPTTSVPTPPINGEVLINTNVPLGIGGNFPSPVVDVLNYTSLTISTHSDVAGAFRGIKFEFSIDGIDWHETDTYTYDAIGVFKTWTIQRVASYFRINYLNGDVAQSHFELSVIGNPSGGIASSHRIGDVISNEDDGQLVKAVISAETPLLDHVNVLATPAGELKTSVVTPVGSLPVSQLTTLHDGKTLKRLFPEMYESAGTGTGTFQTNKYNMSVGAGQWMVYTSRRFLPYYSGKPQKVELTFDNFHPEANVTKRVGYFSSSTVSPYDTVFDGFYLESSGGTITFNIRRNGTSIVSTDITNWSGYDLLNGYQDVAAWQNFTVIEFNFLWLGGAYIELRLVTSEGFTTVHQFIYAGTSQDVFLQSPNQPIRYEIRSTTGTGTFRAICSQVASSGSIGESAFTKSVNTGITSITFSAIGTKYPILSVRKGTSYRENPVRIIAGDILVSSSDIALWTLEINPTLSAPLTYTPLTNSSIESARGNGTIQVSSAGIIVLSGYITQNSQVQSSLFESNFLSWLSGSLSGVQDEYVLCLTPASTNVSAYASLNLAEG